MDAFATPQIPMKEDELYMRRCIELADTAGRTEDFPFGAVLVLDGLIVAEGYNEALTNREVWRHAEMLALIRGQRNCTREELSRSVLYTSVEPCCMCSFAIQELSIRRVVFGLRSPVMGGYSKWQVLEDVEINEKFPNSFGHPPDVTADVLKDEVISGWKRWNVAKWETLRAKGIFV